MVDIVTSLNLRCAETLAEQLHPLTHTETRDFSRAAPSVNKNTPTLMTLIGLRRQGPFRCDNSFVINPAPVVERLPGRNSHPLESAAFARRTGLADVTKSLPVTHDCAIDERT